MFTSTHRSCRAALFAPPHVCAHLALLVLSFTSRVRRVLHISRSASRSRLVPQRSRQRRCLLEHRCSIALEPHLRVGLSNDRQGRTRLDAEGVLDLTHLEREEGNRVRRGQRGERRVRGKSEAGELASHQVDDLAKRSCLLGQHCSTSLEPHQSVGLGNDRRWRRRLDLEVCSDSMHLGRCEA